MASGLNGRPMASQGCLEAILPQPIIVHEIARGCMSPPGPLCPRSGGHGGEAIEG